MKPMFFFHEDDFSCKRNFHLYIFFLFQEREFTAFQRKVILNTKIGVEEIRTKLRELLENNEANDAIFDYIDVSV